MIFFKCLLIIILTSSPLFCQYKIGKSVTKSGGKQNNANHRLHSVVGQAIGNYSTNQDYNLKEGFIFTLSDFISLSDEPASHSAIFTIDSVLNSGSIRFDVQVAKNITNAKGYFILARVNGNPSIILADGVYSALHSESNNTKVVAISTDVNADTITATGLLPSKTYTFYLIPYSWDGSHNSSINYKTDGAIPHITQSTPIPTMGEWALIILGLTIPLTAYLKMKK